MRKGEWSWLILQTLSASSNENHQLNHGDHRTEVVSNGRLSRISNWKLNNFQSSFSNSSSPLPLDVQVVCKDRQTYTDIQTEFADFYFQRRPSFYLLTMMFPCILTSAVAALTFMLPVESGEKVSLEITVLLSLAVFMLVVSESMPPSSDNFPIIGMILTYYQEIHAALQ